MLYQRPNTARWVDVADELPSPFRMMGPDGEACGSGVADGAPDSQSHNDRFRGRLARPSQAGGPFDQFAHAPSCHAMTQMMNSRRHIVLMPCSALVAQFWRSLALSITRVVLPVPPAPQAGSESKGQSRPY
jgi:hypothetical protein